MKVIPDASPSIETAALAGEPESLSANVVHRLELEILKGQRKPGDRLDERQLADHFGIPQAGQEGHSPPGAGRVDDIARREPGKISPQGLVFRTRIIGRTPLARTRKRDRG